MDYKPKNRGWVKDVAIVFLAVLLVLTFFSNTIMNRSLVEVASAYVSSGSITAKVRGSGRVESNGTYQVTADQTRVIRTVMVKAGTTVETGDVLFVLGEGTGEELEAAQEQLRQLQLSYQRTSVSAGTDYTVQNRQIEKAKEKLAEAEAAEAAALEQCTAQSPVSAAELQAALEKLNTAKATLTRLNEDRKAVLDEAYAKIETCLAAYNELLNNPPAEIPETETEETLPEESTGPSYEEQLAAAKEALTQAQNEYDTLLSEEDPAITAAQTAVDRCQGEYDMLLSSAGTYSELYEQAKAYTQECRTTLDNLEEALEMQKIADRKSAALTAIDLQDISEQIEKQKALIEELSGGTENQIIANVSGTVASVECTAGQTAAKGAVLCTIDVPDMGYTLSFSVTNDQAKRLHIGDTATVSNYYWGGQVTAVLSGIATDMKNPQTNKILSFDLEGDVANGTELTISVGEKSANYDIIVPNSAIRSDANGSFVLVLDVKNSALGNRYFARRVPVDIIVSDDVNSAVTGGLNAGDYVITTASAPVSNGDQVRLAGS